MIHYRLRWISPLGCVTILGIGVGLYALLVLTLLAL